MVLKTDIAPLPEVETLPGLASLPNPPAKVMDDVVPPGVATGQFIPAGILPLIVNCPSDAAVLKATSLVFDGKPCRPLDEDEGIRGGEETDSDVDLFSDGVDVDSVSDSGIVGTTSCSDLLEKLSIISEDVNDAVDVEDDVGLELAPVLCAKETPFRICEIPGKGTGMVATKRILAGDVILAEKPLIVIDDEVYEDLERTEKRLDRLVNNMSSEERDQFLGLADCRNPLDPTYLGIFYTNDMNYDGDACLCPMMARANHSCRPNAEFVTRRDLGVQLLVAMYTVEKDEEITICYMPIGDEASDVRSVRQDYLTTWYGFRCTCSHCTLQDAQLAENEAIREEIKELQSPGLNNLTTDELLRLEDRLFQINGKLSYILDIRDVIYQKNIDDPAERLFAAVRGHCLAVTVHGPTSALAMKWDARRRQADDLDAAALADRWWI